jgi:hypothetical protein
LFEPKINYRNCRIYVESEDRTLRGMFGSKRRGVTGRWGKLCNKELRDLYPSSSIFRFIHWRKMMWAGHVARMGEKRTAYRLLVGKPEGRRSLGRSRCRWIDNIKMDLVGTGLGEFGWIGLAHYRYSWSDIVNDLMNLRVPQNDRKLPSGCTTCGISSGTQLHRVNGIYIIFIYDLRYVVGQYDFE